MAVLFGTAMLRRLTQQRPSRRDSVTEIWHGPSSSRVGSSLLMKSVICDDGKTSGKVRARRRPTARVVGTAKANGTWVLAATNARLVSRAMPCSLKRIVEDVSGTMKTGG